ncbi:hypothetical protein [Streptomyces sp. G1]|uniref:hypothetical protein n=1 Tax=Streptomyces sp. G1 TaxID=361572 RepID=UPI00202FA6D3|nr:hypothetical protein [Streptomyces sp. G1]MCM1966297.1 hypothetical protein [Streptomyces sp. G1]
MPALPNNAVPTPGRGQGDRTVQSASTGPMADTAALLAALAHLGLITTPFTPEDVADEEKRAGGAELLRLRMAHALAGLAEMQVVHAAIAAGEAGHRGTAVIQAANYVYEGANLQHSDGAAQAGLLYLLAQRIDDLLGSRTAAILQGEDIGLPHLLMPASEIAAALSAVLNLATKNLSQSVRATTLHETAGQLHSIAAALEELADHPEPPARGQ